LEAAKICFYLFIYFIFISIQNVNGITFFISSLPNQTKAIAKASLFESKNSSNKRTMPTHCFILVIDEYSFSFFETLFLLTNIYDLPKKVFCL
jgi:hypothetical protein